MATHDPSCRTRRPTRSRWATLWACGVALAVAASLPPGASVQQQLPSVNVQGVAYGAQDVQMSLDGVPLTMPDGQGQSQLIDLPMIGGYSLVFNALDQWGIDSTPGARR